MPDEPQNTDASETETNTTTDDAQQRPDAEQKRSPIPPEVERALRKANKEAETLRLRLKEFEDRDKTELQRAVERADQLEREAQAAASRALRYEVAAAKGLTAKQAMRLVGSTREELEADADELLSDLGTARVPSFDGGPRGSAASPATDFNAQLRRATGRA